MAMTFPWHPDHITHLKTRWCVDGATAATIAKELGGGLTKNAVLGKAHRLGLLRHKHSNPKPMVKAKPAPKQRTASPSILKPVDTSKTFRHRFLKTTQTAENPFMRDECFISGDRPSVDLMALEPGMCRWPYDDRPFRYCGERTCGPFSYCLGHARLAYSGAGSVEKREEMMEAA